MSCITPSANHMDRPLLLLLLPTLLFYDFGKRRLFLSRDGAHYTAFLPLGRPGIATPRQETDFHKETHQKKGKATEQMFLPSFCCCRCQTL